jgi:hypothetical protein
MRQAARIIVVAAVLVAWATAVSANDVSRLPVRIYPLAARNSAPEYVADAQALLQSAVLRAASRSERLHAADPLVLRRSCAAPPTTECLARLAAEGIVVTGTVSYAGGAIVVTLSAVDGKGREHGPIRTRIDSFIQSSEPLFQALAALESLMATPLPPVAAPPARKAPSLAVAPPPASNAAPLALQRIHTVPGAWKRTAGPATFGVGLSLLAGGVAAGILGQRLSRDLEERHDANRLTAADASDYRAVDRYALAANTLFVAGGVATAAGLWMWATAPSASAGGGRVQMGFSGRF